VDKVLRATDLYGSKGIHAQGRANNCVSHFNFLLKIKIVTENRRCVIGIAPNRTELGKNRYIVLNTGILPSPWIGACQADGFLEFGDDE
jgi:hypothetical protein